MSFRVFTLAGVNYNFMEEISDYKKKFGVNKFIPKEHNTLPWRIEKRSIWHRVVASNNKVVCVCRNIKDAELIINKVNIK